MRDEDLAPFTDNEAHALASILYQYGKDAGLFGDNRRSFPISPQFKDRFGFGWREYAHELNEIRRSRYSMTMKQSLRKLLEKHAEWVQGSGNFAVLAHCRCLTVSVHKTMAKARESLDRINQSACGGYCHRDHEIINMERFGRSEIKIAIELGQERQIVMALNESKNDVHRASKILRISVIDFLKRMHQYGIISRSNLEETLETALPPIIDAFPLRQPQNDV